MSGLDVLPGSDKRLGWKPLRPIVCQAPYKSSKARFNVTSAGRRSGKTEIAKRRAIRIACSRWDVDRARVIFSAPTRPQAKEIYWEDVKAMTPEFMMASNPLETDLSIQLINGIKLVVMGMERPKRVEGSPLLHIVMDEYGDMRPEAWVRHVRPALGDLRGTADFIGKPVGRNHYYDLVKKAQSDGSGEWAHHTWVSAEVLDPEEVEAARQDMDPLSFSQEFEASFVNFEGMAYYAYDETKNLQSGLSYDPKAPLIVCLDFNVSPGVAAICQDHGGETHVIGEVWIERNSNTPKVCQRIIDDWGGHEGLVAMYGDATGGAKTTSSVSGSDWDLVREALRAHFGGRVVFRVPRANPPERHRLNSVNSRLSSADGRHRLKIDPKRAPHVVKDIEGCQVDETGALVKVHGSALTHITDALGYYVVKEFPAGAKPVMHVEEWV